MQGHFFHYTLITEIGTSSTNATYLAFPEMRPEQKVIVKTFPGASSAGQPEQRQRMLNVAERLKQLRHPHLVGVLEAGFEEGQAYIVSEYIPGGSLRTRLDRAYPKTLPLQQVFPIISQIGQALDALHSLQIVHGHLKPEYILFDINRQALLSGVPLISDNLPAQDDPERAAYNLRYRAPEQFHGQSTALSDQYALCCIAYELFTGQVPFTEGNAAAHLQRKTRGNPTPLSALIPELSATIDEAILRGLAADPSLRHPDIPALLALIQPPHNFAVSVAPALPLPRAKRAQDTGVVLNPQQISPEPAALAAEPPGSESALEQAELWKLARRGMLAQATTLPDPAAFGAQVPGSSPVQSQPQAAPVGGPGPARPGVVGPGTRVPQFSQLPPLRRPARSSYKRVILPLLGILLFIGSLVGYGFLMNRPGPQSHFSRSTVTANPGLNTATASAPAGNGVTPRTTPTVRATPASGGGATATPTPGGAASPTATPTFVKIVSALSASYQEYNQFTNLTSIGTLDWVQWGYQGGINRSASGANLISGYNLEKGGTVQTNGTWPIDFGWSNGTPTASVSRITSCIYVTGLNNGFTISAPASTSTRTLYVYVGVYKGKGQLTSWIIGGPSYANASLDMRTDPNLADNAVYTIHYKSNVPGTRLYVSWTLTSESSSSGNVQLEAVALAG